MSDEDARLVRAAIAAAARAYAPYSRFYVGAAIAMTDGRTGTGANVENASYGLSLCAETNAITAMIVGGYSRLQSLAVIGYRADAKEERTLAAPCGRCRQVMAEFAAPSFRAILAYPDGEVAMTLTLDELLPHAFTPEALDRSRS